MNCAPWYRNKIVVGLSDDLKDQLDPQKTGLEVAASYVTNEQLLKRYLNLSFGNAYDIDQPDMIKTSF